MYYKIVVQVSQVTLVPSKCCKMNELLYHERFIHSCSPVYLPGWVVNCGVEPSATLEQWRETGWSTMNSLLITSHSLGQSKATLCRKNITT